MPVTIYGSLSSTIGFPNSINIFLVDCKSVFCAKGNFFALKRLVESGEYLCIQIDMDQTCYTCLVW